MTPPAAILFLFLLALTAVGLARLIVAAFIRAELRRAERGRREARSAATPRSMSPCPKKPDLARERRPAACGVVSR